MGLGQKFLTWVRSDQFFIALVVSAIFGLGLENFSSNSQIFQFIALQKNIIGLGQKVPGSKTGWPLVYYGSKVCSGRVSAHLYRKTHLCRAFTGGFSKKISFQAFHITFTLNKNYEFQFHILKSTWSKINLDRERRVKAEKPCEWKEDPCRKQNIAQ